MFPQPAESGMETNAFVVVRIFSLKSETCLFLSQGVVHDEDCAIPERTAQVPDLGHGGAGKGKQRALLISLSLSLLFTGRCVRLE